MKQRSSLSVRQVLAPGLALMLIMCLCACQKNAPEAAAETVTESAAPAETGIEQSTPPLESFEISGLTLEFVGAEAVMDAEGHDALRIWFDLTNNSPETVSANSQLSFTATQSGQNLLWAETEDISADNLTIRLRPGAATRYCLQYTLVSREQVSLTVEGPDGEAMQSEFIPDALPGAPTKPLPATEEETQDISYTEIPTAYDLYGQYTVTVMAAEPGEDGQSLYLHFDFANLAGGEGITAEDFCRIRAYQNGIELDRGEVPDSAMQEPIAEGASQSCTAVFLLSDTSPVTVEFSDIWEDTLYLSIVAPGE